MVKLSTFNEKTGRFESNDSKETSFLAHLLKGAIEKGLGDTSVIDDHADDIYQCLAEYLGDNFYYDSVEFWQKNTVINEAAVVGESALAAAMEMLNANPDMGTYEVSQRVLEKQCNNKGEK
jgi:hypothetical protein